MVNDESERKIEDINELISKEGTQFLKLKGRNVEKPPVVTVIVTTFGSDLKVQSALNSLTAQDFEEPIEIIISYDRGSNLSSLEILQDWVNNKWSGEQPIAFLIHDNMSLFRDRQLALEHASGKYFSFLDYDNTYDLNKVRIHVDVMRKENARITFSNQRDVDGQGKVIGGIHLKVPKDYNNVSRLLFQNYVDSNTIFMEAGFYKDTLKPAFDVLSGKFFDGVIEDYFYALLGALKNDLHYIDKVLGSYTYHESNITSQLHKNNSLSEFVKIADYNERTMKTLVAVVAVNSELGLSDKKIFSNYVNLISEHKLQLLGVNSGTLGKSSILSLNFLKSVGLFFMRLPYLLDRYRKRKGSS